jgi:HEPN domain-containing protein
LLGTANNYCKIEIDRKIIIMLNQAYTDTRYPREIAQENLILPSIQTAKMFQEAAHDLYNIVNDILNAEGT